jgi:hypothetical protein
MENEFQIEAHRGRDSDYDYGKKIGISSLQTEF